MKNLLTLILFIVSSCIYSQSERILITGKVTYNDKPIENVNIYNKTSHFGDTTNKNGRFEIFAKENDTLKVSHLKYQSQKIIISKEMIERKVVTILLKEMTNYLSTVHLKSHNLTGNLIKDTQNNRNDTIKRKHDLIEEMIQLAKIPSSNGFELNFEEPILNNVNPIKTLAGGSVGFSIPDKANELRRELRKKKSFPDKLVAEFGEEFFTKQLNIPEEKIHHFITYCEGDNIFELYKKGEIIKLIEILTTASKIYNKN